MQVYYNREDNTKIDIICNLPDEVPIATIKEIGIFDDFNYLHVVANVDTVERQFRVTFTPVDPAAVFAQVDDSPEVVTKEFVRAEIAQHNDDTNAHAGLKQAVDNVSAVTRWIQENRPDMSALASRLIDQIESPIKNEAS